MTKKQGRPKSTASGSWNVPGDLLGRWALIGIFGLIATPALAQVEIGEVSISPIGPTNSTTVLVSALHPEVTGLLVTGGINCSGGVFRPASQPIEYTLPVRNGWNSIYTRTTTDSGEASDCTENRVLHDDQGPIVSFVVSPRGFTSQTSAVIEFTVNDGSNGSGSSGASCRLDNQEWLPCVSPVSLSGLGEGEHRLEVRASDQIGNLSNTAESVWSVDTTAPTATISGPPDASGVVQFSGQDGASGSGIANFFCSIDGRQSAVCSSPFSVGVLAPGFHSLRVKAVDQVGLESSEAVIEWVVAEPVASFNVKIKGVSGHHDSTVDAYLLGKRAPWISLESSGVIESLVVDIQSRDGKKLCSIDAGSERALVKFSQKCQLEDGGAYEVKAFARAGGKEVETKFDFIADRARPEVEITSSVVDFNTGELVTSFKVTDATPIVDAKCVLFGPRKLLVVRSCLNQSEVRFTNLKPGNYWVVIYVKDSVGLVRRARAFHPKSNQGK